MDPVFTVDTKACAPTGCLMLTQGSKRPPTEPLRGSDTCSPGCGWALPWAHVSSLPVVTTCTTLQP